MRYQWISNDHLNAIMNPSNEIKISNPNKYKFPQNNHDLIKQVNYLPLFDVVYIDIAKSNNKKNIHHFIRFDKKFIDKVSR